MGENNHINGIDGLKGIGAIIIAFFWHYQHFTQYDVRKAPLYSIFFVSHTYGYLMVELFFVLSGFGMMVGYADRVYQKEISFKTLFLRD